jgi:hypothetical protein
MRQKKSFRITLSEANGNLTHQLELFALVNLGLVQSLASGILSPADAIHRFYQADNCLSAITRFIREPAGARGAARIQSRTRNDPVSMFETDGEKANHQRSAARDRLVL